MFSRRFYFRFLFEYSLHGLCFPSLINHSWAAVAAAAASEAAEAGLNELMEDDLNYYIVSELISGGELYNRII